MVLFAELRRRVDAGPKDDAEDMRPRSQFVAFRLGHRAFLIQLFALQLGGVGSFHGNFGDVPQKLCLLLCVLDFRLGEGEITLSWLSLVYCMIKSTRKKMSRSEVVAWATYFGVREE